MIDPANDRTPAGDLGDGLDQLVDRVLVQKVLPPSLRISLDNLLAAGESEDEIVRRVEEAAGSKRALIVLAVCAYLDQRCREQAGTHRRKNAATKSTDTKG